MAKVGVISTPTDVTTASGTKILNGPRPPLGSDGATGDYWHDTAGKALWGPKTAGGTWQKVLQSAP